MMGQAERDTRQISPGALSGARGYSPYGIHHFPAGGVWLSSLAGSYIGQVDPETGRVTAVDPSTPDAGTRRVWSDSAGNLWVSEGNAGQLARYDRRAGAWDEWRLPGDDPAAYAVHVAEGATWRHVADQLRARWPKLAGLMDESEHDVLAYMAFPAQHRTKLHSTNPLERLNKEVKRRADVVGIFPNEDAIIPLIGAVLFEQNDEWLGQHRYMQVEAFSRIDAAESDPLLSIAAQAA